MGDANVTRPLVPYVIPNPKSIWLIYIRLCVQNFDPILYQLIKEDESYLNEARLNIHGISFNHICYPYVLNLGLTSKAFCIGFSKSHDVF